MRNFKKIWLVAVIAILFPCSNALGEQGIIKRIAHAGGGLLNRDTYTNSLEALNYNLVRGFEFFEIDFSWTADGKLVCIHDWNHSFTKLFGYKIELPPTIEEFSKINKKFKQYTILTLVELKQWMDENKNIKIITDIKSNNIAALRIISKEIEDFETRIIPQIYQPNEYMDAKNLGYENIIWTLYKFSGDNSLVFSLVNNMQLFAVTMPTRRANAKLGIELQKKGIPTYVHTINSMEEFKMYQNNLGITEVYTDFLAPL